MASQLPGARAAIADNQGLPTPEFYRFLLGLQRLSAGSATSADITALQTQITAIQSEIDGLPKSSFPTLQVAAPVYSQGLLQSGFAKIGVNVADSVIVNGVALQLDGDATAPGNTYLYSTGLTGAKGWNALSGMLHQSANVAVTFGADGTATFDLQPLTDSGAGTFKLITRDSYGRLAGTKAGTTSDVPEGTNLYFTAARAAPDPGYINGLQMAWVSATQVTVSSGAAYIQSAGSILQAPATIAVTFSGLSASTWYHLYLYNNTGTAAIEYSTTAPASPYNGTARAKTGDTSRRYVGSVLTDASGNVINFSHANNQVLYKNNRLRVLSGGQAAVSTMVDCSTAIPVTGTAGQFKAQLNVSGGSSNPGAYFCPGDITAASTVTALVSACPALSGVLNFAIVYGPCPLDSIIHLNYIIAGGSVGASGGAFLDVIGYDFAR